MSKLDAPGEPEPRESPVREAVLDTVGGVIRIAGGMVQIVVGITRLLTVAVLKGAAVAEGTVEKTAEDEETPARGEPAE